MISNVNYNLLKVLDALLTEVHVTRAGEKVFLTQAATSNALNQFRDIFKDPLLVRGQGGKMHPTPFAKSLKPRVQVAMQQFQEVFDLNYRFIPSQAEQTFYVGMSDYIESVLLSNVMVLFYREAPLAKLVIHHLNYLEDEVLLEQGELDLALGNSPKASDKLKKMPLFKDHAVFFAPGYQVYFTEQGNEIVLLLLGGDKKTQSNDIEKAEQYLETLLKAGEKNDRK